MIYNYLWYNFFTDEDKDQEILIYKKTLYTMRHTKYSSNNYKLEEPSWKNSTPTQDNSKWIVMQLMNTWNMLTCSRWSKTGTKRTPTTKNLENHSKITSSQCYWGTEDNYLENQWNWLIHQSVITSNIIRPSRINSKL